MDDLTPTEPFYADDEDTSVESRSWSIQNIGSLEWAMKRVAELRAERNQIEESVAEAHRRLDDRAAALTQRASRGIAFFESQIAKFAGENREFLLGGGKKKSRALLHGTIGWRRRDGRLVVVDPDALARWLAAQPDLTLYRVKVEPEMKALQDNFKQNGVIPPGMEYQVEQERFYVDSIDPTGGLVKSNK